MKKTALLIITMLLLSSFSSFAFDDMDKHWAEDMVLYLKERGIIDGMDEHTYSPENTLNRDAFIKLLMVTLFPNDDYSYETYWAEGYIEKALSLGYIEPLHVYNEPITRLEVTQMIHHAIGRSQELRPLPFSDLEKLSTDDLKSIQTSINMNIINGYPDGTFRPSKYLTRAEAAVITYNLRTVVHGNYASFNLYYGINAYEQYQQLESKNLSQVDSVTFAWGYIDEDGTIDLQRDNAYKHKRPLGYDEPLSFFKEKKIKTYLNVFTEKDIDIKLANKTLSDSLLALLDEYDGLTLDLEMISNDSWPIYITFIQMLRENYPKDKALNITLQPRDLDQLPNVINLVDTVILMLHDYDAKALTSHGNYASVIETPLAPIALVKNDLIYALEQIDHPQKEKLILQFNLGSTQWQASEGSLFDPDMDGVSYGVHPTYTMIEQRIEDEINQGFSTSEFMFYSKILESPYLYFEEGIYQNSLWYENLTSLQRKMLMASDLGINNFSIWRIGNIPNSNVTYDFNILDYLTK